MEEYVVICAALRAMHSPPNHCYANEGELLWLPAMPTVRLRPARLHRQPLIGIESGKKSQFGWVQPIDAMNEDEFARVYLSRLSAQDMASTVAMLRSVAVAAADVGTPFAADYLWRYLPTGGHELKVHRVAFQWG
jgi:hypothetical protein